MTDSSEQRSIDPKEKAVANPAQVPSNPSGYETVDRIRRSHRHARPNPAENPAWANCHMDCGVLLAKIDRLAARAAHYPARHL